MQRSEFLLDALPPLLSFLDDESMQSIITNLVDMPETPNFEHECGYLLELLGPDVLPKLEAMKIAFTAVRAPPPPPPSATERAKVPTQSTAGQGGKKRNAARDRLAAEQAGRAKQEQGGGKLSASSGSFKPKDKVAAAAAAAVAKAPFPTSPPTKPIPAKEVVTPVAKAEAEGEGEGARVEKGEECGCLCTRHTLAGSCTACGRPVCDQENWILSLGCPSCRGMCLAPLSEQDLAEREQTAPSLTAEALEQQLAAYRAKDRLLTFDKQHTRRTQVRDAQADYYESSTWLSEEEKQRIDVLQAKRRAARIPSNRKYKMSIDFAGRKVVTELADDEEEEATARRRAEEQAFDEEGEDEEETLPPCIEENQGLHKNKQKAGDVYRLLKESLAPWRLSEKAGLKGKTK